MLSLSFVLEGCVCVQAEQPGGVEEALEFDLFFALHQ